MYKFISFDYLLTNLFSRIIPHNIFFDYFFSFFSLRGSSIFIWFLVIALVVFLEERKNPGVSGRDKKFLLFFSGAFLFTAFIADIFLKELFRRPRPYLLLQTVQYKLIPGICPINFSFPSTHAATAFAAAVILTYFDKKRKWFYYIIAILISYSRIYLGCHYFFDVIVGAFLGYLISKLIIKLIPSH